MNHGPVARRRSVVDFPATDHISSGTMMAPSIAAVSLLCLAVVLFAAIEPWSQAVLQIGCVGLFAWWGIQQLRAGNLSVMPNALYWPALAFALVVGAQMVLGRTAYRYATFSEAVNWAAYAMLLFVAGQWLVSANARAMIFKILAWFGGAMALFALVQHLTFNGKIYWIRPTEFANSVFGPYVSHSLFAGFVELTFPAALLLALRPSAQSVQRVAYGFAAVLMAISVFVSRSRGGMIALVAEVLFLLVLLYRSGGQKRAAWMVLLVVIATAVLTGWLFGPEVSSRIETLRNITGPGGGKMRLQISRDALHMFTDHPVLGFGLGTFPVVYPKYRSFSTDLFVNYAHNDYVQLLVETGVLGAAACLWFLIALYYSAIRSFDRAYERGDRNPPIALIACTGLVVHSFFDFNLHMPANAALFFFLCAAATAVRRQPALLRWTGQER